MKILKKYFKKWPLLKVSKHCNSEGGKELFEIEQTARKKSTPGNR